MGMEVAMRRLHVESGKINGDAVEAGVHVLPAVGGAVALVGLVWARKSAGTRM